MDITGRKHRVEVCELEGLCVLRPGHPGGCKTFVEVFDALDAPRQESLLAEITRRLAKLLDSAG